MSDLSNFELFLAFAAAIGLAKLLELSLTKLLNRRIEQRSGEKTEVEVAAIKAETVGKEVETVRGVLDEVREHSATKDKRIDTLESTVFRLEGRIERMEAREHQNHQLTMSHETWDLQIYQQILTRDPDYPPPPPLRAPLLIEAHIDTEPRQPQPEEAP